MCDDVRLDSLLRIHRQPPIWCPNEETANMYRWMGLNGLVYYDTELKRYLGIHKLMGDIWNDNERERD